MSFDNENGQFANQVSDAEGNEATSKGSKKWIAAAAAVAVVAALAVGGMQLLGLMGGGGGQPEDVLPANAVAFAKLDLNPSAGQKLAAFRLAGKFPKSTVKVTSQDTSVKESTFGSIFTGDTGWGLDYAKDVQPWLGDRIGVGVFPDIDADKKPEVGLTIAYTDQGAAKKALDKVVAKASTKADKVGYAFADGFVIVSDTTAHAAALVKAGKTGSLGQSAGSTYSADVKSLGADQIGTAWADIAASYKAIPQDESGNSPLTLLKGASDPKNVSGRIVVGLRADPSFVELNGKGLDIKGADPLVKAGAGAEAGMIGSFPADVFGAVTVTGLGKALGGLYSSVTADGDLLGVGPMLSSMGINSASQVETLLGAETGVVVGGTTDEPQFAVRTRGADSEAAYGMASKALKALDAAQIDSQGITVHKVAGPEGIVLGMGSGLVEAMTKPSGGLLGSSESFKQVMPAFDRADFAAYINLAKVMPLLTKSNTMDTKSNAADAELLKPLNALGLTATGGAQPTLQIRLSVR